MVLVARSTWALNPEFNRSQLRPGAQLVSLAKYLNYCSQVMRRDISSCFQGCSLTIRIPTILTVYQAFDQLAKRRRVFKGKLRLRDLSDGSAMRYLHNIILSSQIMH
jgi:hypothetical protein